MELRGYDLWKTGANEDPFRYSSLNGLKYGCLDCGWTGRGGVNALKHHRSASPHHSVLVRNSVRAEFTCCKRSA